MNARIRRLLNFSVLSPLRRQAEVKTMISHFIPRKIAICALSTIESE